MFSGNTPGNVKHSLYTFCITCEFCVLLMPQKNKLQNPLTFRVNVNSSAKWCKMQKANKIGTKREKSNAKYPAIHFLFFAFRDKCIASLTRYLTKDRTINTAYYCGILHDLREAFRCKRAYKFCAQSKNVVLWHDNCANIPHAWHKTYWSTSDKQFFLTHLILRILYQAIFRYFLCSNTIWEENLCKLMLRCSLLWMYLFKKIWPSFTPRHFWTRRTLHNVPWLGKRFCRKIM